MKEPHKTYVFSVRLTWKTARRFRGIAAVDGTTPADLTRDMIQAMFSGNQSEMMSFAGRIQSAVLKHAAKAVRVPGPGELALTAPGQGIKEARKELKG